MHEVIDFEDKIQFNGDVRPQPDANEKDAKSLKYPMKAYLLAWTLIVLGIVLCIVGGMFVLAGSTFSAGAKKAAASCPEQNSTAMCDYSTEAKRIKLPELLAQIKTAYFNLHPNHAFWDPDDDDDDEQRMKKVKER